MKTVVARRAGVLNPGLIIRHSALSLNRAGQVSGTGNQIIGHRCSLSTNGGLPAALRCRWRNHQFVDLFGQFP